MRFHFLYLIFHIVGDRNFLRAALFKEVRAFLQSVDAALHFPVFHNGDLNGRKLARVFCFQSLYGAEIVRVFLVHTVDEDDEGFAQFQAIFDNRFCADGKNAVCADNEQSSASRAQAFVPFALKIVIAGQIEKVYLNAFPGKVRTRSIDGHLFRFFQIVEVADRRAVRYLPHTVDNAAVEQHRFAKRSFALAAVSHNRNVADIFAVDTHK